MFERDELGEFLVGGVFEPGHLWGVCTGGIGLTLSHVIPPGGPLSGLRSQPAKRIAPVAVGVAKEVRRAWLSA